MFIPDTLHIKVDQVWKDNDERNTDRGKSGRAKPKPRTVIILSLPTLSAPGVMQVLTAPKAPHTVGKLREFTGSKLTSFYSLVH